MATAAALLKEAKALNEAEKFKETIALLDDATLVKLNNADLYAERAQAYYRVQPNNLDRCLADANKAIELDAKNAKGYNYRGHFFSDKKDCEKALLDYNKAIELNPKYVNAYNGRGNVWHDKRDYDKALADYNKTIELDPNYVHAYNNRGLVSYDKKEYDKALLDYNKAIGLNPNYVFAYNNRGNVWHEKKDYDKALADYNKAITLDPNYIFAYNNRGNVWKDKKDYSKALADYNKAIELDETYSLAYRNKGLLLFEMKEFAKAVEAYNEALKLKPDDGYAKDLLNRAKLALGKDLEVTEKPKSYFQLFVNVVSELPSKKQKQILDIADKIVDKDISKIRQLACDGAKGDVVHYTKLWVADKLMPRNPSNEEEKQLFFFEPRLRYYNAVYMNDSEEGLVILKRLDSEITKAFEAGQNEEENNIYIGSFLPADFFDNLELWRTYGRDEKGMEAAGCSLEIDTDFFDSHSDQYQYINPDMQKGKEVENDKFGKDLTAQGLFQVLYYNDSDNKFEKKGVDKVVTQLNTSLKKLIDLKDKSPSKGGKNQSVSEINIAIDKLVYLILSEVRYFFKSAQYAYEKEVRVIQFATSYDDKVIIDEDAPQLQKRLYIESNKPIRPYIRKITIGPKAENPDQWIYLAARMSKAGYKIALRKSGIRFR